MNLIQTIEQEEVARLSAGKTIPEFQPGDTVIYPSQGAAQ